MKTMPPMIVLILLGLLAPNQVRGEPVLVEGQRVKLQFDQRVRKHILFVIPYSDTDRFSRSGVVTALTDETVFLDNGTGSDPVPIPLAGIRKVQVPDGKKRQTWVGMGGGALIGLMVTMLMAYPADAEDPVEDPYGPTEEFSGSDAALVFGICVATGTALGWLIKVDRWREVPYPPGDETSLQHRTPALQVGLSLGF